MNDSDVPAIVWIRADPNKDAKGCASILAAIGIGLLIVLAGAAGSGEPRLQFGPGFWVAVATNPLAWLMAAGCYYLVKTGAQKLDQPNCLQWRCPHCSDLNRICSDRLQEAPLGKIFWCSKCKNNFRKTPMPQ